MMLSNQWRKLSANTLLGLSLALCLASCNVITQRLSPGDDNDVSGARAVKAALMASSDVNASPIRVSKRADQIELSGFVESDEEKSAAESIVRKLYPEATVLNSINVR